MKIRLSHNLNDDELTQALTGLAKSAGLEERIAGVLMKATGCCNEPKQPAEPAVRELFHRFRRLYAAARKEILAAVSRPNAARLVKAKETEPLTKEQIRRLQQLIRDRFELVAAQMQDDFTPDPQLLVRWKAQGWIPQETTASEFAALVAPKDQLIRNAFVFGRLHRALREGRSFDEMMHLALDAPLLKPDLAAIAVAEQSAANYITALGDDLAKDAAEAIARINRKRIHDMVVNVHARKLPRTVLDAEAKREAGIAAPRQIVDNWRQLKGELHLAMDDKSQDWDRIAYYELTDTRNQGQAVALMEDIGPKGLVYRLPLPTACAQCKHLFLDDDGTPRLFQLEQVLAFGNNVGRKPHPVKGGKVVPGGRGDGAEMLKPVTGQVHPWCSCSPVREYTGFEPWAKQKRQQGGTIVQKAHVRTYTRKDGTVVKEHDDSRTKKGPHYAAGFEAAEKHGKARGTASAQEAYRRYLRKKGGLEMSAHPEFIQGYNERIGAQEEPKQKPAATESSPKKKAADHPVERRPAKPKFEGLKPDLKYDPTDEQIADQRKRSIAGNPKVKFTLKTMAIADLTPTQHGEDRINPSSKETARIHREWNSGKMKPDDIEYIGDFMPIVVDEKGTVIDGNHRYAAHEINGWKQIRVIQVKGKWEYDTNKGWSRSK